MDLAFEADDGAEDGRHHEPERKVELEREIGGHLGHRESLGARGASLDQLDPDPLVDPAL